jgi:hypothetical protein
MYQEPGMIAKASRTLEKEEKGRKNVLDIMMWKGQDMNIIKFMIDLSRGRWHVSIQLIILQKQSHSCTAPSEKANSDASPPKDICRQVQTSTCCGR